ncbi:pilin [Candidatus Gracilibacteria bacterium]|nr:pilin [Candidatus Gracilibacteria bacterium]
MKKILHILTTLLLLSLVGTSFAITGDQDNDGIPDDLDQEITQDDPNTDIDEREFICTAQDIDRHISARSGFIEYGCDAGETQDALYEKLGVFSQRKVDRITDTDRDGVLDLVDTERNSQDNLTTPAFDETRFICNVYEAKNDLFECANNLGAYSDIKRRQLFDSDRDGVKDFEDQEESTSSQNRRFVCLRKDFQDPRLQLRTGCNNELTQLGKFSQTKKNYILDDGFNPSTGGSTGLGAPGQATIDSNGDILNGELNLDIGNVKQGVDRNDPLKELQRDGDGFILSSQKGEEGIFDLLVTAARDLKNIFFLFATIFFLYLVISLLLSENSEEDVSKFKRGVLWITVGIIVMQLAYSFVIAVYDGGLGSGLAGSLADTIITPLINLLIALASFFFIIMGIVAFYRLVTSNGEEQAATDAKTTLINAILGFLLIQLAQFIVGAVYNSSREAVVDPNGFSTVIVDIINWLNGFVGIAVIIMIIYTGAQILLSAGDEEVLTKAKKAMVYIAIGVVILLINLLVLTFFFDPSSPIT